MAVLKANRNVIVVGPSFTNSELAALIAAARYHLDRWPNEETVPDLEGALKKLKADAAARLAKRKRLPHSTG